MKSTLNRLKLLVLLAFVHFSGSAQDNYLPLYTQYNADNPLLISSAYAGIGTYEDPSQRSQWVGVKRSSHTDLNY